MEGKLSKPWIGFGSIQIMPTWEAFGGHEHLACCGYPVQCLCAQHQRPPPDQTAHATLTPGLERAAGAICARGFPPALVGDADFQDMTESLASHSLPCENYSDGFAPALREKGHVVLLLPLAGPHQSLSRVKEAHVKGMFAMMLFQ